MSLSRRDFLRLGTVAAATASTAACRVIGQQLIKDALPETLTLPEAAPSDQPSVPEVGLSFDPALRLLNRAGYGPCPGDLDRVRQMGLEAYLDEQLNPQSIEDAAAELMVRNLNLYHMDVGQLANQEPRDAATELMTATISRALYSKRQLYEIMVEFWSDHFNIYLRKNRFMPLLKLVDDRDVIRPNALGRFRDLLFASARSPAMLVYLDNVRNHKELPNENYARELMELHTLGIDAGYTQRDVSELARALTGWTVARRGRNQGKFRFDPSQHDDGEKHLLGLTLPAGGGEEEVEQALELLVTHPATADFIAAKLVRRFVADRPPVDLVNRVADTFRETDGDIPSLLRVIFLSDEFKEAPPKLKRPFNFMISTLRSVHADVSPGRQIGRWLQRLGQPLFGWPPPNGYPDDSAAWASNLLYRWNFALAVSHGRVRQVTVPFERIVRAGNVNSSEEILALFARLLFGRPLDDGTYSLLSGYLGDGAFDGSFPRQRLADVVGLMLASPQFQWT